MMSSNEKRQASRRNERVVGEAASEERGNRPTSPVVYSDRPRPELQTIHLTIGCLVFYRQDQIDFTGSFEVMSRIPDATVHVLGRKAGPVCDVKGLILTAEMAIADAPELDVLVVSGGLGQQALMEDAEILGLIARQAASGRIVFSICTFP